MSSLANYFHTLRYLRPVQVFGRIRFKLYRPRPDLSAAPGLRPRALPYPAPIAAPRSMIGPDQFRFLNLDGNASDAVSWGGSGQALLWVYNLHYFDDLNAADAAGRHSWHERLMERWIDENSPGAGIGWDPYPVSRRVVNWIKWLLGANAATPKVLNSIAVQARWLESRIETHLQGNHLMANAKALIFAGVFFDGEEADHWRRRGLTLLLREIAEQVLPDGGHFERSPMYHAAFLEDLLDAFGIMQAYGFPVDPAWQKIAARMLDWLEAMTHPDSNIAFFNDAAIGVAPAAQQLREYAARLNVPLEPAARPALRRLMPSGYVSIDCPPFFLVCDAAPVGPDHLPAHAHADTLSFELSVAGRRVLVNSGTSEYGLGSERQRQRGSAAHNALVLDDENSSEVWAGFRVARRAHARLVAADAEASRFRVVGEHDGYRRLPGRNLHRRTWTLNSRELVIEDVIEGRFRSAKCYFHLHPDIRVQPERGGMFCMHTAVPGIQLQMGFDGAAAVEVVEATWHPEFGVACAAKCIVVQIDGARLTTMVRRSDSN